jgi:hypothetical protein
VIVEHDQALATGFEKASHSGHQARALARCAEAEREHLDQRVKVPGAHSKPVNPSVEV